MRIVFTEDDGNVHNRVKHMRGGLLRNFHIIKVLRKFPANPKADLWFHGLSHLPDIPLSSAVQAAMHAFNGGIVFFQNDDHGGFATEKIPATLMRRAALFIRNVWPADGSHINPAIRERTGLLNPLLKPHRASPGKPLFQRAHRVSFLGAPTGGERFTRIDALRMIKKAGLPFTGGLINSPQVSPPPADLLIRTCSPKEHARILSDSQISLVLHGYNPLTFRLFESFSRRCLVLAQDLSSIRFADCGLKAGVHYALVRHDLSDLVDRIRWYLDNLDEAQSIADAGFRHFKSCFAFSGVNLPQPLYRSIIATWGTIDFGRGRPTPYGLIIKMLLPFIRSL